jgi:hypothetical protein
MAAFLDDTDFKTQRCSMLANSDVSNVLLRTPGNGTASPRGTASSSLGGLAVGSSENPFNDNHAQRSGARHPARAANLIGSTELWVKV